MGCPLSRWFHLELALVRIYTTEIRMLTRRTLLARLPPMAMLGATFTGAAYATAVEPFHVQVTRYGLTPNRWPSGVKLRIAILTDFHAHPRCMGEADLSAVVTRTNALMPDVTVLLGDYCSQSPNPLSPEAVVSELERLAAPLGVYAIQGNHDWADDRLAMRRGFGPTRTEQAFLAAGMRFLENEAAKLELSTPVWLVGLESEEKPGQPDRRSPLPRTLDQRRAETLSTILSAVPEPAPVILLAHEPDIFATDLNQRVALTLSGHTHGGQIRIFGWSPWIPSRYGLRYAHGHIVERERDLIVSAGLGAHFVAGRPLRIGIPPEIVIVDLGADPEAESK